MNPLWIGIIFLINSAWLSSEPQFDSKGRMIEPLDVTFGLNDEYFKSEEICWQYFDNHPSFKILDVYKLIILFVARYTGAAARCNLD